jgi:hypothetical protein
MSNTIEIDLEIMFIIFKLFQQKTKKNKSIPNNGRI